MRSLDRALRPDEFVFAAKIAEQRRIDAYAVLAAIMAQRPGLEQFEKVERAYRRAEGVWQHVTSGDEDAARKVILSEARRRHWPDLTR